MTELIITLPVADPSENEGDPTSWIGHLGDQWTAFADHIEDGDGNMHDTKDVADSARAMLAAVHQVELWRAERARLAEAGQVSRG